MVRRQTTVIRAPRSRARLIPVTICRRLVAKPRTPHLHCAARAVLQAQSLQCAGSRGKTPCLSLGVQKGVFSFAKENTPFAWQQRSAPHDQCSAARCNPPSPPARGGIKKGPSLAREKALFVSLSKPYRYFCMPSVARAGSPETEMVNLTPVALLKRSSSFRKSSAAWLHSPPVILNRLSMKMWEIS